MSSLWMVLYCGVRPSRWMSPPRPGRTTILPSPPAGTATCGLGPTLWRERARYSSRGWASTLLRGVLPCRCERQRRKPPLQEKLTVLAENIGLFGMVAASLMFVLLSLMDLYYTFVQRKHPFYYKKYLDNLTTAVTIVVVAVPEGLPLSVTIALAYSMKQMFKENNLVRHLAACETMGGATTICTDKTGTITQNKMTVTDGVTSFGQHFFVPVFDANGDVSTTSAGQPDAAHFADIFDKTNAQHAHLRSLLLEGIVINSKSSRKVIELQKRHQRAVVLTGSKTEQALIMFVERTGIDPMELRLETLEKVSNAIDPVPTSPYTSLQTTWPGASPRAADSPSSFSKQIHTYPFTSARKRMTTGIALSGENKVRYHVKGASELILSECEYVIDENGERVPLRHDARQALENTIFTFAKRRLRTLAIAFSEVPLPKSSSDIFVESDEKLPGLTLLAIIAIQDPVRPEVPKAIAQCRSAGVLVRMITGDNKATAISIAREVGIYGPVWQGPAAGEQGLAVEGPQFRELAKSERTLNAILPRLQVISRASPLDKQILVAALMKRGEVVAVTGDGTNDAPALKNANVGFSMNSGTEVAKNASDVVILDDKFSTIVTATKWGRNVRDNISKFLQFQMTVNVAAVVVSFIGALFDASGESPLKPVQLLWINLIMDTLAALALATEYPTEKLLDRPPQPKSAPLISMRMWTNILGQSLYQIILQLLLLHSQKALDYFGVEKDSPEHLTVVFNVFVLLQLCNEFNARILDQSSGLLDGLQNAPLFI
ncbi:Ca2+-transporting ATPase [Angomonas deanei]|nr:Ca2+-transporting ATPase [Angomonas deanei]|eukprot:EPY32582.1 Ca2+-transporting ATPase [Angomonas deanei]